MLRTQILFGISLLIFTGGSSTGCMGNLSGRITTTTVGDLSHPIAHREQATAPLTALCGDGELTETGAKVVHRRPYLQQVGSKSAMILWTGPDAHGAVEFTTPETIPVVTTDATVDTSAHPGRNARQLVVRVDGLAPATVYCYRLMRGDTPLTARAGFRTAPTPGAGAPVRVAVFGDSGGGGADQEAIRRQLGTVPFDLMLHVGDLAYPVGSLAELEERVFAAYPELFRSFAMFPVAGNHEYKTAGAAPFREVFALPENGGEDGRERWYSFDWGDVHFVGLDTERTGRAQAAWLEKDLAANKLPWTVVFAHKPPYSSGSHGGDGAFVTWFVPILERHHVALVLGGHEHNYERMIPRKGVTYIVTGGGGRGVRPVKKSSFTAFSASVLQFVYLTIENDLLTVHAIDGSGREFDQAVIRR